MSIELGLKDKVVIVTGGAGGLCSAVADAFAKQGANVVIADLDVNVAQELSDKIRATHKVQSIAIMTDVSNKSDVDNMVAKTLEKFGKIDILVNGAGVDLKIRFIDIEEEEWDRVHGINAKGTYLMMRAVLPHMIEAGDGKVVNFSSIVGKEGYADFSHYSASKFAVTGLTQAVAKEMAEYNINVNAICPGVIRTHLWEHILDTWHTESGESKDILFQRFLEEHIPMRRAQTPEDIANVVLFLSSELAKNITGECVNVNGGMRMD
jgi:meso-butanediol dehydrogenase/(S,S)-butanediol dehydrogenase/diacetyl reductase